MKVKEQVCGVIAIITSGKKILFAKRSSKATFEPGKWGFVGETIKFGEDHIDAIKRGIMEEVSLKLKSCKFLKNYSMIFHSTEKIRHALISAYVCKCSGRVKINSELDDFKWVSLKEAKRLELIKGNEIILADLEKFLDNA